MFLSQVEELSLSVLAAEKRAADARAAETAGAAEFRAPSACEEEQKLSTFRSAVAREALLQDVQ